MRGGRKLNQGVSTRSDHRRRSSGRDRLFAVVWHLAWAGVTAVCAGLLAWRGGVVPGVELFALGAGAAAAVVGALLSAAAGDAARTPAIVVWALAAAAACLITGGAAGPLAAWCLAPLAAACAFRKPDGLALGAAAAVAVAAICVLGGLFMPLPEASAWARTWLSLLALATVALGFGAGLVSLPAGPGRRERRLREAMDAQPQMLLMLDAEGRTQDAFGAGAGGLPAASVSGRPIIDLACPEDRSAVETALRLARTHGGAEVTFRPVHDPQGFLVLNLARTGSGLAAVVRDGRAQRDREAELERARASAESQNAGKSRFLANMSHELRTPLNAIMGFSDILRQRLFGPMSDRYAEYAELIHESGSHLLELINDVLDMSKIEAERFELLRESFDARDAVAAVLRLMRGQADQAGINLRGVLPREALEADADRRAIKQITLNLISNALKFTPRGGAVTVLLEGHGENLQLSVSDTGVGIAPEDLERLGRPFEQAGDPGQRAAGSGLGLSLVRAFARLHGGDMSIESVVDQGTTITVRMPVLVSAAEDFAVPPPAMGAANEG